MAESVRVLYTSYILKNFRLSYNARLGGCFLLCTKRHKNKNTRLADFQISNYYYIDQEFIKNIEVVYDFKRRYTTKKSL